MPEQSIKPNIAAVKTADSRELKSLESFIQMKESFILKQMYVQKNLDANEEARWLANYLIQFPIANKSEVASRPFWPEGNFVPNEEVNNDRISIEYVESSINAASSSSREATDILRNLQLLECKEYFGSRRQKLHDNSVRPTRSKEQHLWSSVQLTKQPMKIHFQNLIYFTHVQVWHFVAMNTSIEDREVDIPFFLRKVIKLRGHSIKTKTMMVSW